MPWSGRSDRNIDRLQFFAISGQGSTNLHCESVHYEEMWRLTDSLNHVNGGIDVHP
jgi:hypothetical protein